MPRCMSRAQEAATEALAQQLGLAAGAPVFHTLIVHFEDGVPLQCEDRYVNPASAPDYLGSRLHADHADAVPVAGDAVLAGAVFDRGGAAHRAARPSCSASAATSPAWWCVRRTFGKRACRSRSRGWCTRARATCCRENSSHEPGHRTTPARAAHAAADRGLPPRRGRVRAPVALVATRCHCCARASTPTWPRPARAPRSPAGPATRATSSRTSATGRTTRPIAA